MYIYSDPEREEDTYALPNVEVFYAERGEMTCPEDEDISEPGFYYWYCFPGCVPDGDPYGPFDSEEAAIEDARSQNDF